MTGKSWTVMAVLFLSWGAPALAFDIGLESLGVYGGLGVHPDQFHGGFFADLGQPIGDIPFHFRPSGEFGWGNGVVLGAANADALYRFRPGRWRPYAGGGFAVNFIDVTNGVGEGRGLQIEPVLNVVGGVEWGPPRGRDLLRYLVEARLGFGQTPELKLSFGLRF